MFFEPGFLATRAPMYMDIVTLYFALFPFLLGASIFLAIRGKINMHYLSQMTILAVTLIMIIIFEIGVRMSGGFREYVQLSSVSYDFLLLFLAVHIFIAIMAVGGWIYLVITSYRTYLEFGKEAMTKHPKMGRWIFAALTLTSIMGCSMYGFLFMM